MPVHDWTKVDAGIFHDFHHAWIEEIKRALNRGLLPSDYYALAEQVAGRFGPDVLALQRPTRPKLAPPSAGGAVTVETAPPRTKYHARTDEALYAAKANAVAIRHRSDHKVVALIEIVSPGNKDSTNALKTFLRKAGEALTGGVHLLIVDLFPPGRRDPEGLHPLIWESDKVEPFVFSAEEPLTLMAYVASPGWEAFVDPLAVGDELPPMPLFLTPDEYVPVPLEATYQSAWEALPDFWRDVVAGPA